MKNILILGANSAMAKALIRRLAGPATRLILASRNLAELRKTAADAVIRGQGPQPLVLQFDALALETHARFAQDLMRRIKTLDEVYVFFGALHPQAEAQKDFRLAQEILTANYVGAVSVLERLAPHLERRRQGLIVGISSVAGDRGRQSNYFYGSAKAAFSTYLQGLRNRLSKSKVHVLTVKPGFVDTPMTRHLKKGLLFASPEAIARGLIQAVRQRRNVVYLPGYWRWIMLVIKSIPEALFKRLSL
jgi:decaprenylphospho-beta-D-erythro-pentofuranosid-2-ulose 2-reductase